jgi:aminoglycoside 3-N-acetyltransferase I
MSVEIIKLTPTNIDDFSDLIKVFANVFEWEDFVLPRRDHLQRLLGNPNFLVFVGKTDKQVVGGLTAHVLDRYDTEKPSAYIYDVAVITNLQRKGIGKLLIASLNDYCKQNGFDEVFVQAETDDVQAVNFYKSTPISSELNATHFTYSFDNN